MRNAKTVASLRILPQHGWWLMKATTLELYASFLFSVVLTSYRTLGKEESCVSSRFQCLPETCVLFTFGILWASLKKGICQLTGNCYPTKDSSSKVTWLLGIKTSYIEVCQIPGLILKICCFLSLVTGPQKSGSMPFIYSIWKMLISVSLCLLPILSRQILQAESLRS